ncbi:MAG TPA: hypothetical protein PK718_02235 [Candidatus Methanofastidiosa archaeon]|nr:hypothetical protein [Candidatus Methanofastidiosa archaeon]HPR41349.1 hypothetical protein [Candidatus Methanofastidiosa archaeon]
MLKKSTDVALVAMFLALIAIFQLLKPPLGYVSPWGISVDLVALPVLLAFFLYGFRTSITVCFGLFFIVSIIASEGLIGGTMKWLATMPMIITPAILSVKIRRDALKEDIVVVIAAIVSMVSLIGLLGAMYKLVGAQDNVFYSPIVVLIASAIFYFAFFFATKGMDREDVSSYRDPKKVLIALALALVVRGITTTVLNYYFALPLFIPGLTPEMALQMIPWWGILSLNIIQGILEVSVAWLLVFRTKAFSFVQKAFIQA